MQQQIEQQQSALLLNNIPKDTLHLMAKTWNNLTWLSLTWNSRCNSGSAVIERWRV